ncbi:MAG: hypothetical protein MZW92_38845 [Comamonadaceae bacterium]|nr:hypothetical protein [Comamonadaceae bacterium]
MSTCPTQSQATVEFALRWHSADAEHSDRLYFEKVNFWRDFFPGASRRVNSPSSRPVAWPAESFAARRAAAGVQPGGRCTACARSRSRSTLRSGMAITPRAGRFYPRGMFAGSAGCV